ncbi:MAG: prepilin peptidase [Alphaproteobacteria bacterium]|nr:prepilin peptidase [Alphaproteobacteria bacterium]
MIALIVFLTCLFSVIWIGVLSGMSDFKGMTIPNWHSGFVLSVFFLCYLLLWFLGGDHVFASLSSHLLSALIVFVVTLGMFMAGGLGAADSKLGTSYALWVGLKGLLPFLFYMALAGGVLALIAILLRRFKPCKAPRDGGWIARVQAGESRVPYGIAIVVGALASFVKIGYLDFGVWGSF